MSYRISIASVIGKNIYIIVLHIMNLYSVVYLVISHNVIVVRTKIHYLIFLLNSDI